MSLSNRAYKLLRKINKHPQSAEIFTDSPDSPFHELIENNYVYGSPTLNISNDIYTYSDLSITTSGIIYLEKRHRENLQLIISIIALVLAAASIVLSPFFNILFSYIYGI